MSVMTSPAIKLNGPRVGELVSILIAAFDYDELEETARDLDIDLAAEIEPPEKPLKVVAESLVLWLNRRERIGDLLDVAMRKRPDNEALPQFIDQVQRGDGKTEKQVGDVRAAIGATAKLARDDDMVRGLLGPFKPMLEVTRAELDCLARYKALHDCLHTLQLQLAALTRASRAFPADESAGRELRSYVAQFRRLARSARQQIADLPTVDDEAEWVAELEQAVEAAHEATRDRQPEALEKAVQTLRRLPLQAERINMALTFSAKHLHLENLGEALASLLDRAEDRVSRQLKMGHQALLGLMPRLEGLVDAHDGWERVEKALRAAEAQPPAPPAARVPRWTNVKSWLVRLCPAGTEEDPLADPVALAERWETETEQRAAENHFLSLRAAALHKFYDVDLQLRDFTERLADIINPLNLLVEML